jgi:acetyl-CoA carboxylase biotin carboxyl carrier protein
MANKFDIDPDLVRKLSDLLGETGLSEIEYESAGRRIRVARNITGNGPVMTFGGGTTPATAAPAASGDGAEEPERPGNPITAPMVGTVFLSPEPGAGPFVKVGDTISEGQTVMLIEAMKTYNPVRATTGGKVLRILVGDSMPVEFGEELILVE